MRSPRLREVRSLTKPQEVAGLVLNHMQLPGTTPLGQLTAQLCMMYDDNHLVISSSQEYVHF